MRKILFLDIDGVLNTALWQSQKNKNSQKDKYGYLFDSNSVTNLAKIIDETGADIVISSSWKCMGLSKLQKMWEDRKLPGKIIDVTPDFIDNELLQKDFFDDNELTCNRGCEIKVWLNQHGKDVSHYAILDDMDDVLPEQEPHFVWIDPEVGITEGNVAQAVMILKHMEYPDMSENTRMLLYEKCIEETCNDAIQLMREKRLKYGDVHTYIRHIPIRGHTESTENAFRVSDDCLNKLYEYSKGMGFVPIDWTYEDFINSHIKTPEVWSHRDEDIDELVTWLKRHKKEHKSF